LSDTCKAYQLARDAAEMANWIKSREQHALIYDENVDFDQAEVTQKVFDELQSGMLEKKATLTEMNELAIQLECLGQTDATLKFHVQLEDVNKKWSDLERAASERLRLYEKAHEVQRFHWDIDETRDWIQEKDGALGIDDLGRDLRSVQALQRKHEGFERDLAALDEKIRTIDEQGRKLMKNHPDSAETISHKQDEIHSEWTQLKRKAQLRKEKLTDSYDLQRYLSDFRDLSSWMTNIKGLIESDELAKDVTGAEALLDHHQDYKTEIDARAGVFHAFELFGRQLLDADHFGSVEIQEKLSIIRDAKEDLEKTWIARRISLDQCLELQLFYRDCEQAEHWMSSRESFLLSDDVDNTSDNVEALIKKHEDFDRAIKNQEDKIEMLASLGDQLIAHGNYASEDVHSKKEKILKRWKRLRQGLFERRSKLGESQTLQQFSRDADEIESWMLEKLQLAEEESYKDPANIQSKHQKHQVNLNLGFFLFISE